MSTWFWYPFTFNFCLLIFSWSVIFHPSEHSGTLSELQVWQRWKGEKSGVDVQQWEIYLYWATHVSATEELVGSSIKPHITTDVCSAAPLIPVSSASWLQVFWPFHSIYASESRAYYPNFMMTAHSMIKTIWQRSEFQPKNIFLHTKLQILLYDMIIQCPF